MTTESDDDEQHRVVNVTSDRGTFDLLDSLDLGERGRGASGDEEDADGEEFDEEFDDAYEDEYVEEEDDDIEEDEDDDDDEEMYSQGSQDYTEEDALRDLEDALAGERDRPDDGQDEGGADIAGSDAEAAEGDSQGNVQASFFIENDAGERAETAPVFRQIGMEQLRQLLTYGLVSLETHDDETDFSTRRRRRWHEREESGHPLDLWEPVREPVRAGMELEYSGDFGRVPQRPGGAPASVFAPTRNVSELIMQRKLGRTRPAKADFNALIPNTDGAVVAQYPAPCYCGQYSEDASFFYTCTRDMRVHIYDTTIAPRKKVLEVEDETMPYRLRRRLAREHLEQATSLNPIQTVEAQHGQWTITDASISPDNQWLIYSSITPYVGLSPVRPLQDSDDTHANQVTLDFGEQSVEHLGIWSLRFSGDSREIIAGAQDGMIFVYDIDAQRRVLSVEGHDDDVNGVTFADSTSSHVFASGSDDTFVKVWDRRSLSSGKPSGVLPGHTEGVTYVSPKGDGRYCISNSKDQSLRLWDLRMMRSSADVDRWSHIDYNLRNWDYRYMPYRPPRYQAHPEDCSVMTYRAYARVERTDQPGGHSVLRTLIRCHFSPASTTGQKYIYSGGADGRILVRAQVLSVLTADMVARRRSCAGTQPRQHARVALWEEQSGHQPVCSRRAGCRRRRKRARAAQCRIPRRLHDTPHAAYRARRQLALQRAVDDERVLGRPRRRRRK